MHDFHVYKIATLPCSLHPVIVKELQFLARNERTRKFLKKNNVVIDVKNGYVKNNALIQKRFGVATKRTKDPREEFFRDTNMVKFKTPTHESSQPKSCKETTFD